MCATPPISFSSGHLTPVSTSTSAPANGAMIARRQTPGRFAGRAVERAVALALAGEVDGIVTAPLEKAALLAGGYAYPGHTEMLAGLTGRRVAMMLAATRPSAGAVNPLRVVLATTHIALRDVVAAVTRRAILDAASVTRAGLREWFGIAEPQARAVCAQSARWRRWTIRS